jgi:osmotically-inducible protein OsmY
MRNGGNEMTNKKLITLIAFILNLVLLSIPNAIWAQNNNERGQKIEKSIEKRLQDHNLLNDNHITVATDGKTVLLSGSVPDIHQMLQIEEQAGKAAKGYIIVNNLEVAPTTLTDQQLRDRVEQQLQKDVFYSIFDWVGFDVKDGAVTLAGWVRLTWSKKQLEHAIEKVPGVTKIDDQIQFESRSIFDDELRDQAANVIYNDPSLEPYASVSGAPIHIIVNNGDVILEGQVSRASIRNWAVNTIIVNTKAFQVFDDLKVQG